MSGIQRYTAAPFLTIRAPGGSIDATAQVTAVVAEAYSRGLAVYFPAVFRISSDIPNFHDVQKRGPGGVQVSGSRVWYAEPSVLKNTFSARQTVYVDGTLGSDSNGGLGAGALAVATLDAARAILVKYGYLPGNWSITLAAAEYTTGAQFYGMSNAGSAALYIEGPTVSTFDNTSPPASNSTTGAAIPTVIFRPDVAHRGDGAGFCIDIQHDLHVYLLGLKARDWGTKATGSGTDGFVNAQYRSYLWMEKCHIWDSSYAATARDFSHIFTKSCLFQNNNKGVYAVAGARVDTGYGATAAGDTTAPLFALNTFGLDLWEGATSHPDYAKYSDNTVHVMVRKGGHAAFRGPTFENTGSNGASIGIQVQDGANYNLDGTEVWSGTHAPRIKRFNFASDVNETSYAERHLYGNYADQTTSTTATLTVATLSIPKADFVAQGQSLKIKLVIACTNPNSTIAASLRFAGSFVTGVTIPVNSTTAEVEIDVYPTGAVNANTQRARSRAIITNTTGTLNKSIEVLADPTQDFTTAAVTVTATIACANGSDSATCKVAEIWRRA